MNFNVFSWNMQGWGNQYHNNEIPEDAKIKAALHSMRNAPHNSRILMLQECGNPESTGLSENSIWTGPDGERYICHINAADPTADNLRCSTAILVSENLDVEECGAETFAGVTRPCVYVVIGGIRFATMHAIANGSASVPDVKKAIENLAKKGESWLLMGDFNSNPTNYAVNPVPEKLNDVLIGGTYDRPICICKMIYSKNPTQGRDGNRTASLDFAFLSSDAEEGTILHYDLGTKTKMINEQQFAGPRKYLSDHNLIGLSLE